MRLSVVTTMYRSAPYLRDFRARLDAVVRPLFPDHEILFVDDGSPDDSLSIAKTFLGRDERVKIVVLSRNFGHHAAMLAGLAHAAGDLVFLIDSDLEEPPELLAQMVEAMRLAPPDAPIDVVYAVQPQRRGAFTKRVGGALFYRLFNALSPIALPADLLNAKLMTRRFVAALLLHQEREPLLGGLVRLTGFRQHGVIADKSSRSATSYTLLKRLDATVVAITSFSDRPLVLVLAGGLLLATLSIVVAFGLLFAFGFLGLRALPSAVPAVLAVAFVGGLTIAAVGVLGLYVARILVEVKRRPTIVSEVHTQPGSGSSTA